MPNINWNQINKLWSQLETLDEQISSMENRVQKAHLMKTRPQILQSVKEELKFLEETTNANIVITLNKMLNLVQKIKESQNQALTNELCLKLQNMVQKEGWLRNFNSVIWTKCGGI